MNVQELYDQFRSDMGDEASPYFWTDTDVFRYMDDAYKTFVRLTGGIADFTSDLSRVDIVAGEALGTTSKLILRTMEASRVSDGGKIDVVNMTDLTFSRDNDYGKVRPVYSDTTPGTVRYMVIGAQRGLCKWVQVPMVDDVAQLYIYRLPIAKITSETLDFEFDEIGEEHVMHLGTWMRHKAYGKADADSFNGPLSDKFKAQFEEYCRTAKAEWDRYKYKNREVAYGGV